MIEFAEKKKHRREPQKNSQNDIVKKHLLKHGSISTFEAFKFWKNTRLGARIWDLKHIYGMTIKDYMVYKKKKHYKVYYIPAK